MKNSDVGHNLIYQFRQTKYDWMTYSFDWNEDRKSVVG